MPIYDVIDPERMLLDHHWPVLGFAHCYCQISIDQVQRRKCVEIDACMLPLDSTLQHCGESETRKLVDFEDALDGQAAGDCSPT